MEQNKDQGSAAVGGEAVAEGSRLFAWLVRASQCGIEPIEQAAKVLKDYYQGVGPEHEYDQFRAADAPSEPSELLVELREAERNATISGNCYADIMRRAADALDSQPSTDEPTERESLIACLGDDAVTLLRANPDDEMAQTMREAAAMLENDGKALDSQPTESEGE